MATWYGVRNHESKIHEVEVTKETANFITVNGMRTAKAARSNYSMSFFSSRERAKAHLICDMESHLFRLRANLRKFEVERDAMNAL